MINRIKKILKPKNILLLGEKQELIGSSADPDIIYYSDYDLQEYIDIDDDDNIILYNELYEEFKKKVNIIKDSNDIYFIDFKSGHINNNIPIKWTIQDINKGYKIIDDKKYSFVDSLRQKSIIKIDIIYIDENDKIYDITQNYYIKVNNNTSYDIKTLKEIKVSLLIDFKDLFYNQKNYYKALKRLYSYYELTPEKKKQELMKNFFNSNVGQKNKILSDLKVLILLLEQKNKKIFKSVIINNVSFITFNITDENLLNIFKKTFKNLNKLSKFQLKYKINKMIDIIYDMVNNDTLNFINLNNIIKI